MAPSFIECPSCGRRVAEGTATCPNDGTLLGDGQSGFLPTVRKQNPLLTPPPAVKDSDKTVRFDAGAVRRQSPLPSERRPVTDALSAAGAEPEDGLTYDTVRSDPLVGMQLGEYVVKQRIGVGGMGIVYQGEQPLIGKQVAIKILRPEVCDHPVHMERLLAEARAVNAIRHRGIIDIFSFGKTPDGRQYFIMEYLQGSALDHAIGEKGGLPVLESIRIADEILDALAAAHEAGVIHRDLKPNNIFLVRQPGGGSYVKVLDFGLAKQTSATKGGAPQTQAGLVVGTPEYMAPEQVRGERVTSKTDLYSFGIVLFEMLTGQLPFTAKSPMEYLARHLEYAPTSPVKLRPELPPALVELVLALLAKAPEDRPTVEDTRAGLQRIALSLRSEASPSGARALPGRTKSGLQPAVREEVSPTVISATPPAPGGARSRTRLALVAGSMVLLAAGAGLLALRPAQPVAAPVAVTPPMPPPSVAPTEPRVSPEPAPTPAPEAVAVAPSAEPAPAVNPPVEPVPVPPAVDTPATPPSLKNAPGGGRPRVRASPHEQLSSRIKGLRQKLAASGLPADEQEQAGRMLDIIQNKAEHASTPDDRKAVADNLERWKRRYLGR
jgi:serine/threonine-protein kinase